MVKLNESLNNFKSEHIMRNILLIVIVILLSSHTNSIKAQTVFTNIEDIVSNESCFANERKTYDGFIEFTFNQMKSSFGRKANRLTIDILKNKVSNERYEQWKETYDCQLFSYLVDGTLVDGLYLNNTNVAVKDDTLKPLVIFNRGGNGSFGRLPILSMLGNAPIVDAGYVMLASQYRAKDEFGGSDLNDVLHLVTIGKALSNTDATDVHMVGVSRGGMMTYMAARQLKTLKTITVWAGPTNLEDFLSYRPEMERVYQGRIPNYSEQKTVELTKRSVMKWSKELSPNLPILILHGDADKAVDVIHATELAKQFEANNQPHKLLVYKGDNHGLRKNRKQAYIEIIAWMKKYK